MGSNPCMPGTSAETITASVYVTVVLYYLFVSSGKLPTAKQASTEHDDGHECLST